MRTPCTLKSEMVVRMSDLDTRLSISQTDTKGCPVMSAASNNTNGHQSLEESDQTSDISHERTIIIV